MARYIRSLHHGGAKGMQHREHRSKKNRHPSKLFDKKKEFYVKQSDEKIAREEQLWDVILSKKKKPRLYW